MLHAEAELYVLWLPCCFLQLLHAALYLPGHAWPLTYVHTSARSPTLVCGCLAALVACAPFVVWLVLEAATAWECPMAK